MLPSDGTDNSLKSLWRNPDNVFGIMLLNMGLLCRAENHLSNLDCAILRAMTGPEWESAVILYVIFANF